MAACQYPPFHLPSGPLTPFYLPPTTPFQPPQPPTTLYYPHVGLWEEGHTLPSGPQSLLNNLVNLMGKFRDTILPYNPIVKAIKGAGNVALWQEDADPSPTSTNSAHPDHSLVDVL